MPKKYNQETTLTAEVKSGDNVFDFDLTSKMTVGQASATRPPLTGL